MSHAFGGRQYHKRIEKGKKKEKKREE